jgi:lysophospholipase L1-like esterase
MHTNNNFELAIFGDSHSVIWEGNNVQKRSSLSKFPNVKVFHLGPALAYNLMNSENNGLGKWGNDIFSILKKINPTAIMLCFGEIDIRTQIIKRAVYSNQSIQFVVRQVVERLNLFAEKLFILAQVPVLIWEPVASSGTQNFSYNPDFPATGSEIERNYATFMFSKISRELCSKSRINGLSIYSFGILNKLINFYQTKAEFFEDGCHLNASGLMFGIKSLKDLCVDNNLPPLHTLFEDTTVVVDASNRRNIASLAKVTLSSHYVSGISPVLTKTNTGFCFHTLKENKPYALIDLGYAALILELVIFNRFDDCQSRASTLQIFAGLDNNNLIAVFRNDEGWDEYEKPLSVVIPKNFGPIRFIKLQLNSEQFFHLGEVQILENSFLRIS